MEDIIIIGGGVAGLATGAFIQHKKCLILEKKKQLGTKLLMSGSGQCNFTNIEPIQEFFTHYGSHGKHLRKALYNFTNYDLMDYLYQLGVESTVDMDTNKVFPESREAKDVLDALVRQCNSNGHRIYNQCTVKKVAAIDNGFEVITNHQSFKCHQLVIATGGRSYPSSGSSGDGYSFAKDLGHKITKIKPGLTHVLVQDHPFQSVAGISFKNVLVELYRNQSKVSDYLGDLLITHEGLSGPVIINHSRSFQAGDKLYVRFNSSIDSLEEWIIHKTITNGKIELHTLLKDLLPSSMTKVFLKSLSINPKDALATLTKENRKKIVTGITKYPFVIKALAGYNKAMVTVGGVDLSEIEMTQMESKLLKGLFFAGEVIDIDGDTGGYNIQACFSQAYLISKNI